MFIDPTFRRSRSSGFSLVELLLVMAILPVVFYAVFSNFTVGMKVWQSVNVPTPVEDLAIFYQKARADLQNTFIYATIPLEGDKGQVTFPSIVEAGNGSDGRSGIGRVRIFYDDSLNAIAREVWDFSEVYRDTAGRKTLLLKDVRAFELSYFIYSKEDQVYEWADHWQASSKHLPVAVRMSFMAGTDAATVQKTYFLPTGG